MADDSHGMGIPLPADSTKIHQYPAVTRAGFEKVAEVLAGGITPGIEAAVAEAADGAIESKDLVRGSDPRVPALEDPEAFHVRNKDGGVPFKVQGDSTYVGHTEIRPETGERFTLVSSNGRWLFDVDPETGMVYAPNLHADTLTLGGEAGGAAGGTRRVVLNICAGQSNMEGRGRPYGPEFDPADSRITMWDWPTSTLKTATVPLSSQQQQTGLSVATVIARQTIATEPAGTQVVILNAAAGGSGMVAEPTQGTWRIDYAGPNPRLFENMMAALDVLLPAVETEYGTVPEVRFYWHQGEADGDAAAYAAAFDAMVAEIRNRLGLPNMPVTLGGMLPGYASAIVPVHKMTPARLTRAAFAAGPPNGGGSANVTDLVHYHRAGVERLGADMYTAHRRALANTLTSVPTPPLDVSATFIAGTLTAQWSIPLCRVTDYAVEYSLDGGAWTAITGRPVALDNTATVTGLSGTVARVRVSTVNEVGTSHATVPITALGA